MSKKIPKRDKFEPKLRRKKKIAVRKWIDQIDELIEDNRATERLTEKDLNLIVNI